jgi:carbonic anhydrase
MTVHKCDALVVCCIDFKFQKYIHTWLDKNFKNKTYDFVGFAGSTKDLSTVLKQLDISVRLHHIKQVVLIHHEDCGAYGKESTPERHTKDLHKAKDIILKKYPHLQVDLYYLHLDGKFEKHVND